MKKTKFLIGACLAFTLAGCSDDDIIKTEITLPVSGDEITFGANTEQFSRATSRTIYGEPDDYENYNELSIEWQPGQDQVRVYSPQASSECRSADYTVQKDASASTPAYYLQKNGEIGVRWGDTNDEHYFYAFYPLTVDDGTGGTANIGGLQNNTTVSATIPVAQERGNISTQINGGTTWKIVAPNMTYAMMAGTGTWQAGTDKNVSLNFKPIVLVLDVVITANDDMNYKVLGVSVRSKTQPIVGSFTYDIASDELNYTSPSSDDNTLAYVDCQKNGEALELNPGEKLNVKFFLLPRDIKAGELTVSVLLENGQTLRQALVPEGEATDGADLIHGKIIKVRTPKINPAQTSNWMSMIGNDVLFASQLSMPGTKHSYTYQMYNGELAYEGNSYNSNNDMMQTFQTLNIDQQFEAGVRAFDIKLTGENANIYVSTHTLSLTIGDMLNDLKKKLDAAPSEFVIVSINYVDAGLSPQQWLNAICTAINNWSSDNQRDDDNTKDGSTLNDGDHDYFREIVSTTTVGAMRHGIGIMIHYPPTDDGTTPSLTSDHVNVISNYDTSVQNTSLVEYDITSNRGTGHVTIQNLQQMNNPELSRYPYFITEQYALGTATSMDLIQTKKNLINSLFTLSRNNNATGGAQRTNNLYVNDLGGFCVVNNNESTGWAQYRINTYYDWGIIRDWNYGNWNTVTDYTDIPTDDSYFAMTHYHSTKDNPGEPSNPSDNDRWLEINAINSQLGQGGNNALAAEKINGEAGDLIYNLVNEGRTPLGVVYMNFAGTDQVQFDRTYTVNGVRLPSLIMSNNFKFALATSSDTTSN